jgi:cystathionine beta-lyase/cystathionine gamma-synthase
VGAGYVYTRWANPTTDLLEAALADLEGAAAAEAFASGMAAISGIFLGLCEAGDRVVAARQLYGGTHSLLAHILPRYGIEAALLDVNDFHGIDEAVEGAKLLYCETIGNPRITIADLPRLAEIARKHRVPLVVDNTFASPMLCRPLEHGADISVHSATKFLGGHHDLMGGIVCGSPSLLEPIAELARELGPVLSPFNAWLTLRGMATLQLRVERSCATALQIAEVLESHPRVETVYYPGLPSDDSHALALALLGGRGGGTLGFDVLGGREAASEVQEQLAVIKRAASLGGTHSLIVHAASITHTQLTPDELETAGISAGFCRLSVGLEDPEDLIADLDQAFNA